MPHIKGRSVLLLVFLLLVSVRAGAQVISDTIQTATPAVTDTNIATTTINRADTVRLTHADSAGRKADSALVAKMKKTPWVPKPKKAGLYSAILPGSGQIYNRQYWKAPVIYAGLFAAGYFFQYNLDKYHTYRKAYFGRLTNGGAVSSTEPEDVQRYTTENLKTLQDEYRKYLDLTVLFSALGYTAQVIDAIAAAHLRGFDMSRDISFRFQPVVMPNYIGAGVVMNLK